MDGRAFIALSLTLLGLLYYFLTVVRVTQTGRRWFDGTCLRQGSRLVSGILPVFPTSALSAMSLPIVYLDEHLIVADKPTLLLSVPGRGPEKQDSVVTRLARDYPGVREVHRLDWETSGLLLLARTREAHGELSRQFREREVAKRYVAVVYGEPAAREGEVDLPLRCDWPNRPRQMVDRVEGKPSLTCWQVLSVGNGSSRVALTPVTGRSHQLRVHMQSLGHPILGDRLYAHAEALAMADRLLLHAAGLSFRHPQNGERVSLTSSPPF